MISRACGNPALHLQVNKKSDYDDMMTTDKFL